MRKLQTLSVEIGIRGELNMKKKVVSPFERDTVERLEEDSEFTEAFLEELLNRPLSVQLSILNKFSGISQVQLASRLHVKQKLKQVKP